MAPELPAKVLIVRLGAIGDVVSAQVVANAIREARPEIRVGWVAHDLVQPLLAGHPSVDRVHVWPRGSGLAGLRRVLQHLRVEGYGLTLNLQRTAKSGLLASRSGAPRVLGFDRARTRELSWIWSTERIPPGRPGTHMLEWYLEFVDHLGLPHPQVTHRLPRDEPARSWAETLLAELGAAPVLVNLGASKPPNRWSPERFGELAARLATELAGPVCLTGGPEDVPLVARVQARAGGRQAARSLVGETGLLQLAELSRRARLLVACDTGPMHLAAAVGTPVVALFGPSDPRRTGPWGEGHRVVQSPTGHMDDLAVDDVLAAAVDLAATRASR